MKIKSYIILLILCTNLISSLYSELRKEDFEKQLGINFISFKILLYF